MPSKEGPFNGRQDQDYEIHPVALKIMCDWDLEGGSYDALAIALTSAASVRLDALADKIFRDCAVTPQSVEQLRQAAAMVNDAMYLAALSTIHATPTKIVRQGDIILRVPIENKEDE